MHLLFAAIAWLGVIHADLEEIDTFPPESECETLHQAATAHLQNLESALDIAGGTVRDINAGQLAHARAMKSFWRAAWYVAWHESVRQDVNESKSEGGWTSHRRGDLADQLYWLYVAREHLAAMSP